MEHQPVLGASDVIAGHTAWSPTFKVFVGNPLDTHDNQI